MDFKKIIIVITIFAVGLCGTLLAIEKLKPSNNDNLIQETTTVETKSDATPIAGLNLAEPPPALEMITVPKSSEESTQTTSDDVQEKSTQQQSPKSADSDDHTSQRVYVQQPEAPANNEPSSSPAPTQANPTTQAEVHQSSEQTNTANDSGDWWTP